jgi:hypothetical protein
VSRPRPKYCLECNYKRLYRSEGEARSGLAHLWRTGEHLPIDYSLTVYPCRHNKGWHIGHDVVVRNILKVHLKKEKLNANRTSS